MPILPLPQFEADLKADQDAYAKLKAPTSIVVRFGAVKMVGEFPYDGDAKPGCGSKMVARTHRGTELAEMLTSTCPNAGCSKSVTRKEMLEYINNSGGRDYPFFTEGRILRVATVEDMNKQSALDAAKHGHIVHARECVAKIGLPMKIVDAEEILGGERITFYFTGTKDEHVRVDFRPVVMELAHRYHTRVEMRQVGARDEARLTADYEKCGQHCCCKSFLKVLKPVSMKNAKIQKATLDPLKISGRCGRLMCCLRYEESTYDDLRKRLPKKKVPVMTPDGTGIVIETQILTQLVLVRLDKNNEDGAYPVENIEVLTGKPGVGVPGSGAAGEDDDEGAPGAGPQANAPGGQPAPPRERRPDERRPDDRRGLDDRRGPERRPDGRGPGGGGGGGQRDPRSGPGGPGGAGRGPGGPGQGSGGQGGGGPGGGGQPSRGQGPRPGPGPGSGGPDRRDDSRGRDGRGDQRGDGRRDGRDGRNDGPGRMAGGPQGDQRGPGGGGGGGGGGRGPGGPGGQQGSGQEQGGRGPTGPNGQGGQRPQGGQGGPGGPGSPSWPSNLGPPPGQRSDRGPGEGPDQMNRGAGQGPPGGSGGGGANPGTQSGSAGSEAGPGPGSQPDAPSPG